MKILVFGAGGIGSVVGGFLARMGQDVSLLGRAWHLDAVRKHGLSITGLWGDYRIKAFQLYTDAGALRTAGLKWDLIILTVKSYDTKKAVLEILPLLGPDTMLLSLQNGLGNIETILEHVKPEQFLIGRVIFGVELLPGVAKVTVSADSILIGPVPRVAPKVSAGKIASLFNLSKIPAEAVADILPAIWSKVIYNCALNGICSFWEVPYGRILEREKTRKLMEEVVGECYGVALKKKIALDPPAPEGFIRLLVQSLIPKTASHFPSMLQDIRKGKRTDIDALNGAICRLGSQLGVPTPANQEVVDLIRSKVPSFFASQTS